MLEVEHARLGEPGKLVVVSVTVNRLDRRVGPVDLGLSQTNVHPSPYIFLSNWFDEMVSTQSFVCFYK